MVLGDLKQEFVIKKGYEPEDLNELLDFARNSYLKGKICLSEYRSIIRELETIGATKPTYETEKDIITEA
ncbi:YppF-like protein [Bacillus sp. 491mf]|uniref:YppF family protein n=1 Tax=Bacillus TaxID=1386 RepID=UPI0005533759|nr:MULTISPECIES: YppF family protein [unclassified Bacillus (in: firmicutes)]SFC18613.1 YppF-like protein [Bacillus sp. 491mf]